MLRAGIPMKWPPAGVRGRGRLPPGAHPHPPAAVAATGGGRRVRGIGGWDEFDWHTRISSEFEGAAGPRRANL
jgi:hypothetical protein